MAVRYSVIEIFTSEAARYQHKSVAEGVVHFVRGLKIAARCIVTRGIAGCYENGEAATTRIEILSFNMPLKIEIILPTAELEKVLPTVERMVTDGIVVVEDMVIRCHKASKRLIPSSLNVRDVMTPSPASVTLGTAVDEIVMLLLSADYHGLPVVDADRRPVGIVTESDLIERAGMPVRLGLLGQFDQHKVDGLLASFAAKKAGDIMTCPVVVMKDDDPLTAAVEIMLAKKVKRLPVVNGEGRLVGMLSRLDVFRTITKESPKWKDMRKHNVEVNNVRLVSDIMHTGVETVGPNTPLDLVIETIDTTDIQRAVVVDADGKLLGMVFDGDLLSAFSEHHSRIWDVLLSKLPFSETARRHREVLERARAQTAGEVMRQDLITVSPDDPIDEAIRRMVECKIKILVVIDTDRVFKGIVTRDSLLQAGHESSAQS
jgi:CBS domain-containing protein